MKLIKPMLYTASFMIKCDHYEGRQARATHGEYPLPVDMVV
jgi:hypothetical protein